MTDIKRIKDTVAQKRKFKDWEALVKECDIQGWEGYLREAYNDCIELASNVEAGITIEQACNDAAKAWGCKDWEDYCKLGDLDDGQQNVIKRAIQLYAQSAVAAAEKVAVEKERELLRETAMRCQLSFPENEQDEQWFNEGCKGQHDFHMRILKFLCLGNNSNQ